MNAKTILSADRQVTLPQDVCDALGLQPGQVLDVVASAGAVVLRPEKEAPRKSGRSAEEIFARLREIAPEWKGPPVSIEEMDRAVDAMFAARAPDDI